MPGDTIPYEAVMGESESQLEARTVGAEALEGAGATLEHPGATTMTAPPPVAAADPFGKFRYYFPDAEAIDADASTLQKLDALANAMVEPTGDPLTDNGRLPAILTYFGQFIDHDITANTDRETATSMIEGNITPLDRGAVTASLGNLRDGSLALDSLYGDTAGQSDFANKLAGLMRHPTLRDKMRLGTASSVGGHRPPLPADPAVDLPRLGLLLDRGELTLAELQALPPELRGNFLESDGTPIRARAIVGDGRNDENLVVAQTHTAMLRFHNRLHDVAGGSFEDARRRTRWHYQWLVANAYLPMVCDPDIVRETAADGAPLYSAFFAAHGAAGSAKMPMPLEFSVAAFRFGHSMIRGAYDYNRFFGESKNGSPTDGADAPFDLLFAFTGNGRMFGIADKLPQNWIIDWERFVKIDAGRPQRAARKIDTFLAPPLSNMRNEAAGVFKHLAQRNLRRGYRLKIATAQGAIAALQAVGITVEPLTTAELHSGATGAAVQSGGFTDRTPLWFYLLKEAELRANGQHLGPLGSYLVANTLLGLIFKDDSAYHQAGWSPADSVTFGGDGDRVDTFENMLRFTGQL